MLKIEKLDLPQLKDLKNYIDDVITSIDKRLTDYSLLQHDPYFKNIPDDLKGDYDRRNAYSRFSNKIENEMIKRIDEIVKED